MTDFLTEDDLFDEGVIVDAAEVELPELLTPESNPKVAKNVSVSELLDIGDTGIVPNIDPSPEPGDAAIVPPEFYNRINAQLAPDGSTLTPNQISNPHLWRAGDKRTTKSKTSKKANRINVREMCNRLAGDTMLSPLEVLFYIMNANEEARHHLGLRKSDRISANLRAKCAQELMAYMAPKLKSVEVQTAAGGGKSTSVQIFLPANEREQGEVAEQPAIVLPEKDGVTIPFSPELAAQLILADDPDDEEMPEWAGSEDD